ncbi:MAG TPA: hypothetical protein DCM45_00065 [Clostridiales bacterium]|nr:hypothetical protein [Clostridiales bacterium]
MEVTLFESIDHSQVFPAKVFVTAIESSSFHWHYDLELIIVLKGMVQVVHGPERLNLRVGDIFLINSKVVHAYHSNDRDNLCLFIQFPLSVFAQISGEGQTIYFNLNSADLAYLPVTGFQPLIRSACRLGYYSRQKTAGAGFRAAGALADLLANFIDHVQYELHGTTSGSESEADLTARISSFVDDHLESPSLATDLSTALHLHDKAIYRCLKNSLGISLKELIDTARVEKARQLLRSRSANIMDIAEQCGFISEATFYRVFKKYTGLTPAEYRDQGTGKQTDQIIQGYLSYNANEADQLLASLAFEPAKHNNFAYGFNNRSPKEVPMNICQNPLYSFAERAADLVSRMTLEEKIMQVGNNAAAIPRLGLPRYDYWSEASHGFFGPFEVKTMDVTSYPVCLAMSQSWDAEKIHTVTQAISDEIRAHHNLNDVELHMWCPTINLARDPRNGRSDENFGEDPFLAGKLAASYIRGLQGEGESDYVKVVATPKHYALNSSENNRHSGSSNVDEATLREYYTKVFEYAIREGHAQSIMTSYNRINGVPASVNDQLLTTLLREEWGFDGFVVSDCGAVADCYANPMHIMMGGMGHYYCKSLEEASAMTLTAGTDISCGSEHKKALLSALRHGLITEDIIDRAIIRTLLTRFRLGLFDDPSRVPFSRYGSERVCSPAQTALSVDMANDTIVLLKNERNLLPINTSQVKNILVVGPNAIYRQLGGYSAGQSAGVDTIVSTMALAGIRSQAATAGIEVSYEKGWCIGKEFGQGNIFESLPGFDPAEMMIDINPGVEGDDLRAVLSATFGGREGTVKRHVPEDPDYRGDELALIDRAVAAARKADLVVVIAGTDESTGSEEKDRETLDLPYGQDEKIQRLIAANANTVVVVAMGAVTGNFIEQAPALINAHFAGQAQGEAIANILFGKVNPNAKLSATWYKSLADLPHINDYGLKKQDTYDKKARTYQYFEQPVLFPFGFGLSYTNYEYSNLRLVSSQLDANDTLQVSVDVTNAGSRDGSEIVQLYVAKVLQGKQRDNKPLRQLRGWAKVWLAAGETRTVSIAVPLSEVTFWSNLKKKMVVESGTYRVEVGRSSADLPCQTEFNVNGEWQAALSTVYAVASRYVLPVGAESRIRVAATLADTSHLDLVQYPPQFASSDPAVATVDSHGTVKAVTAGVATISCTVEYQGQQNSAAVAVAVKADA